jgi:hypothetical protein
MTTFYSYVTSFYKVLSRELGETARMREDVRVEGWA